MLVVLAVSSLIFSVILRQNLITTYILNVPLLGKSWKICCHLGIIFFWLLLYYKFYNMQMIWAIRSLNVFILWLSRRWFIVFGRKEISRLLINLAPRLRISRFLLNLWWITKWWDGYSSILVHKKSLRFGIFGVLILSLHNFGSFHFFMIFDRNVMFWFSGGLSVLLFLLLSRLCWKILFFYLLDFSKISFDGRVDILMLKTCFDLVVQILVFVMDNFCWLSLEIGFRILTSIDNDEDNMVLFTEYLSKLVWSIESILELGPLKGLEDLFSFSTSEVP